MTVLTMLIYSFTIIDRSIRRGGQKKFNVTLTDRNNDEILKVSGEQFNILFELKNDF